MLGPRLSPCTVDGEVSAPLLMGELLVVSTHGGGDRRGATFLHGWTAIKPDAPLLLQGPRKIGARRGLQGLATRPRASLRDGKSKPRGLT